MLSIRKSALIIIPLGLLVTPSANAITLYGELIAPQQSKASIANDPARPRPERRPSVQPNIELEVCCIINNCLPEFDKQLGSSCSTDKYFPDCDMDGFLSCLIPSDRG